MGRSSDEKKFPRPENSKDSLQVAIKKWINHQYYIWQEANAQPIGQFAFWGTVLRILIIVLAGVITTMSNIDVVPRVAVTAVGGVMTVLTGVEGYLKLADRKVAGENQRRELLAERDKWGYQWMVRVELENDTEKALQAAKELLVNAPQAVNDLLVRYASRSATEPATKPT